MNFRFKYKWLYLNEISTLNELNDLALTKILVNNENDCEYWKWVITGQILSGRRRTIQVVDVYTQL